MMNLKPTKIIVIFILVVFFVLITNTVHAESNSIKRVISLVYDDSGSMFQDNTLKWSRANYAVQVFCGLLGDNDDLYVTYMSDYKNTKRFDISRGINRQNTINEIRSDIKMTQNTPFESVIAATENLKIVKDVSDIENWIIIMTDGRFFENDDGIKIDNEIRSLMQSKKRDGKEFRLIYIGIGDDALTVKMDESFGVYSKIVRDKDIFRALQEAAGVISGKTVVYEKNISIKNNKMIVSLNFPLENLIVFSQKQNNKIIGAYQKGNPINSNEFYSLEYPKTYLKYQTDETLVGNITFIKTSKNDDVLSADTVEIEFENEIKDEDITILYEPSIDLDFQIFRENNEVLVEDVFIGDEVTFKAVLKESKTEKIIAVDLLPQMPKYRTLITQEKELLNNEIDSLAVKVNSNKISVSGTCLLKNFFNLRKTKLYEFKERKVFIIEGEGWNADLLDLDKNSEGNFKVLNDDRTKILKEDFDKLEVLVGTKKSVLFDIIKNSDLTISIKPKYWYKRFLTSAGEIPISINGKFENGKVKGLETKLFIKDLPLYVRYKDSIIWIIYILLVIWYLVGVIKKPRFDKNKSYVEYSRVQYIAGMKQIGKPVTLLFNTNWIKRWFVPYIPETYIINGLVLEAGKKNTYVILPTFAQHENMKVDGFNIEDEKNKKPYRISAESEIEIKRGNILEIFKYKQNA